MAFATGIGLGYFVDFSINILTTVLSVLLFVVLVFIYLKIAFFTRHIIAYIAMVVCGLLVIGNAKNSFNNIPQSFHLKQFTVLKQLDETEKWDKYKIQNPSFGNGLLYVPSANKNLIVGAIYYSNIKANKNVKSSLPQRFVYHQYLRSKKLGFTAFAQKNDSIYLSENPVFGFRSLIASVQKSIAIKINVLLKDKEIKGLFSAILLGDKSNLDEETQSSFSNLGISHFLAVSGLHVGIIYILLSLLLGLKKFKRHKYMWFKIILVIVVIWFYALISGFSLSVSRAAFMFSCFLLARGFKRNGSSFNVLCFCAFVNLCFNPYVFLDVGFQLSYAAVASIVLLFPKMQALLSFKYKASNYLWDAICVTTCAQLGTMPIVIYTFGFFPAWFLFSNVWLSIFSFVLTISAFLFVPLSYIPTVNSYYANLVNCIYKGFIFGVDAMANLPYTKLPLFLDKWQLMALLLMLFSWFLWLFNKKSIKLYLGIFLSICLVALPQLNDNENQGLSIISEGKKRYYIYNDGNKKWLFPQYYTHTFDGGFVKNNADASLFQNKFRLPEGIRPIKYGELVILHIVKNNGTLKSTLINEETAPHYLSN